MNLINKINFTKITTVFLLSIFWLLIFNLSLNNSNPFQLLNILGFIFVTVVPGYLTLSIFKFDDLNFWVKTAFSVAVSIFEIILIALAGNYILPLLSTFKPISKIVFLYELSILFAFLSIFYLLFSDEIKVNIKKYIFFDNFLDILVAFTPIIFVIMSVLGAIRLNNGANGNLTLIMLILMAIYSSVIIYFSDKFEDNSIATALFFMSLSLLLMTSLRGWFVTGHDIQREYRVMELTKTTGYWKISNFKDAYNACMSITILPVFFLDILKIKDPYIFKILFQIIFALVPNVVYFSVRKYAKSFISLLSAFYFISFPTFFSDMPFLNRQEIAFLFLMLMFYIIFNESISLIKRRITFVFLGIGMVLSHYSTTYTVIAILLFLTFSYPVSNVLVSYIKKKKWFKNSSIHELEHGVVVNKPLINVWMVSCLVIASFLWSSVLTNTASNSISRVVIETLSVINNNAKEGVRAGEVSYNLFSFKKIRPEELLADYQKNFVDIARSKSSLGTYYPETSYEKYGITATNVENLPLTKIGNKISGWGVNVEAFNSITRQASAKLLQLLIIIGFIGVLFGDGFLYKKFEIEYILLSIAGLIFMASQVLLPVLSVEYGLLRAFQQSLLFLGVFIVIGSLNVLKRFSVKSQKYFTLSVAIFFFISISGIFTQILGGYGPQLHLNNAGSYYDIFYLHGTEISGINWLSKQVQKDDDADYQSEVQTDRFSLNRVSTFREINTLNDIYPGLIRRDSYIYMGYANVKKMQANISYGGTNIVYKYPMDFLNTNKDLLFSNGGVRIYR